VPEYFIRGGVSYRILADQLGSPLLVVDARTGRIAQRLEYDEFGGVTADTNPGFQSFGFAGGLYDPDTKLVRFGARDYDAETGRWTAKDPSLFRSGSTNLYQYAFGDPINLTDPDGLQSARHCGMRCVSLKVLPGLGAAGAHLRRTRAHPRRTPVHPRRTPVHLQLVRRHLCRPHR
jgi:RHS repeat-associated protein